MKETGASLIRATIYIRSVPLVHYERRAQWQPEGWRFFFCIEIPLHPSVVPRPAGPSHLHTVGQFPTRLNSDRSLLFLPLHPPPVPVSLRCLYLPTPPSTLLLVSQPFQLAETKKPETTKKKTSSFFQDAGVSWRNFSTTFLACALFRTHHPVEFGNGYERGSAYGFFSIEFHA